MLLTFHFIPHLAVAWLAQPEQLSTRTDTSILLLPFLYKICVACRRLLPQKGTRSKWRTLGASELSEVEVAVLGSPSLTVLTIAYGFCGRKATLNVGVSNLKAFLLNQFSSVQDLSYLRARESPCVPNAVSQKYPNLFDFVPFDRQLMTYTRPRIFLPVFFTM